MMTKSHEQVRLSTPILCTFVTPAWDFPSADRVTFPRFCDCDGDRKKQRRRLRQKTFLLSPVCFSLTILQRRLLSKGISSDSKPPVTRIPSLHGATPNKPTKGKSKKIESPKQRNQLLQNGSRRIMSCCRVKSRSPSNAREVCSEPPSCVCVCVCVTL